LFFIRLLLRRKAPFSKTIIHEGALVGNPPPFSEEKIGFFPENLFNQELMQLFQSTLVRLLSTDFLKAPIGLQTEVCIQRFFFQTVEVEDAVDLVAFLYRWSAVSNFARLS
jgi:hypothetical protein